MSFNLNNMFIKLKNAQSVKKPFIIHKKQKLCARFLNVLWDEGYILGYRTSNYNKDMFEIFLKYNNGKPLINKVIFLTKPSKKIYLSLKQLWKMDLNFGLLIISTNKGVFSKQNCQKLKIGGKPFIYIC